jgi:hypothetical protein
LAEHKLRYGVYLGAVQRHKRRDQLFSASRSRGAPAQRPRLRAIDLHRLLTPYVSFRFSEQMRAVVPLALMLIGFQALALRTSLLDADSVALGIMAR